VTTFFLFYQYLTETCSVPGERPMKDIWLLKEENFLFLVNILCGRYFRESSKWDDIFLVQTLIGCVLADDVYIGLRCIATRYQYIGCVPSKSIFPSIKE
jgi:hypothetical protein